MYADGYQINVKAGSDSVQAAAHTRVRSRKSVQRVKGSHMRGVIWQQSNAIQREHSEQYSTVDDTRGSRTEHEVTRDTVDDRYR